jgi:hypothetical protein
MHQPGGFADDDGALGIGFVAPRLVAGLCGCELRLEFGIIDGIEW